MTKLESDLESVERVEVEEDTSGPRAKLGQADHLALVAGAVDERVALELGLIAGKVDVRQVAENEGILAIVGIAGERVGTGGRDVAGVERELHDVDGGVVGGGAPYVVDGLARDAEEVDVVQREAVRIGGRVKVGGAGGRRLGARKDGRVQRLLGQHQIARIVLAGHHVHLDLVDELCDERVQLLHRRHAAGHEVLRQVLGLVVHVARLRGGRERVARHHEAHCVGEQARHDTRRSEVAAHQVHKQLHLEHVLAAALAAQLQAGHERHILAVLLAAIRKRFCGCRLTEARLLEAYVLDLELARLVLDAEEGGDQAGAQRAARDDTMGRAVDEQDALQLVLEYELIALGVRVLLAVHERLHGQRVRLVVHELAQYVRLVLHLLVESADYHALLVGLQVDEVLERMVGPLASGRRLDGAAHCLETLGVERRVLVHERLLLDQERARVVRIARLVAVALRDSHSAAAIVRFKSEQTQSVENEFEFEQQLQCNKERQHVMNKLNNSIQYLYCLCLQCRECACLFCCASYCRL